MKRKTRDIEECEVHQHAMHVYMIIICKALTKSIIIYYDIFTNKIFIIIIKIVIIILVQSISFSCSTKFIRWHSIA